MKKYWSNGKLYDGEGYKITSFNAVMSYSNPVVWEGIRAYQQQNGKTEVFKVEDHIYRLFNSAKIMGFEINLKPAQIIKGCRDLVKVLGGGDLYLRPIAYGDFSCEGVDCTSDKVNVDIYAIPLKNSLNKNGIKMVISSLQRSYPNFMMQAKTPMNYGYLGMYQREAARNGVDDVLIQNKNGHIVEATVANFFIVKDNQIFTPRNDGSILPGITRRIICNDILLNHDIMFTKYKKVFNVVEKDITRADIYTADEMFLVGTYAEVTPVLEVDGTIIGSGYKGVVTNIVQLEYENIIRGKK